MVPCFYIPKKDDALWSVQDYRKLNQITIKDKIPLPLIREMCHIQVHLSGNNIPAVKPPLNHTSPPFMAATFLATHFMAVLQPSRYSVFHDRDTPIQLGFL